MFQFKAEHNPDYTMGMEPMVDELTLHDLPVGTDLTLTAYETQLITSGGVKANGLNIPDGDYIGQRKLVTLKTITETGDTVVMASPEHLTYWGPAPGVFLPFETLTLTDEGDFALFEWSGAAFKWILLYNTGTVDTGQE